jgi:hypothetical protein
MLTWAVVLDRNAKVTSDDSSVHDALCLRAARPYRVVPRERQCSRLPHVYE